MSATNSTKPPSSVAKVPLILPSTSTWSRRKNAGSSVTTTVVSMGLVCPPLATNTCFLHPSGILSGLARERLHAIEVSQDGFDLAEKDLKLRGGGNIYGTDQSGFQTFKLGTMQDIDLMSLAKDFSKELLDQSPDLKRYPAIRSKLVDYAEAVHFE